MLSHDDLTDLADETTATVREWMRRAALQTQDQKRSVGFAHRLTALLEAEGGLEFATAFADEVIRVEDRAVAGRNLERLSHRIPTGLPWFLRSGVLVGGGFGAVVPRVVVPVVRRAFQRMIRPMYLDAAPQRLEAGIKALRDRGIRPSLSLLGPAVMGDAAAEDRIAGTLELLSRSDVDCVSIAMADVVGDEPLWGFERLVSRAVSRLGPLYEFAAASRTTKFVNLIVAGSRELELALAVFEATMDSPALRGLEVGITLPAGLPEALPAIRTLTERATARRAAGGAGIKISVAAATDLMRDRVTAIRHGWREATFATRSEADASFKRILDFALTPERTDAARLGVISHNLFDLGYAWNLGRARGVDRRVEWEMPLGLTTPAVEAARADLGGLLLSAPVVPDVHAAAGYLVGIFRQAADGAVRPAGTDTERDLDRESDRFLASLTAAGSEDFEADPDASEVSTAAPDGAGFSNAPLLDPAIPANRRSARSLLDGSLAAPSGGTATFVGLETAAQAGRQWGERRGGTRAEVLRGVGEALATRRGRLIQILASEGGTLIGEADRQVSQAVDFARYYADLAEQLDAIENARFVPSNLTVVLHQSGRFAEAAGAVLAALAAGSGVILRPDLHSLPLASALADGLWDGGVPRDLVQLADPAPAAELEFLADPLVDRILLSGAAESGRLLLSGRPELPLQAVAGGRNSIIVTPSADLDAAVRDVVASAFRDAGQAPTAANLVILVGSVAESDRFRSQLIDAVSSLRAGYPQDLASTLGPLTAPASGETLAALTTLEEGERWLVEPRQLDESGRLWSPGLRDAVLPGGRFHLSDAPAPVLGIQRAETLAEAVVRQNERASGLAAGLQSLDTLEVADWLAQAAAGSLFVNRETAPAVVWRQPSGGWGQSVIGPVAQAGGPNALLSLGAWEPEFAEPRASVTLKGIGEPVRRLIEAAEPGMEFLEFDRVRAAARSDQRAWDAQFGTPRDVAGLGVQRNVFRYRPVPVTVRLAEHATAAQLVRVIAAATIAGAPIAVSSAVPVSARLVQLIDGDSSPVRVSDVVVETDDAWHARVRAGEVSGRIRLIGGDPTALARALGGRVDAVVYSGPVTTAGRIELLPFLREQTVSMTAHRYGHLDQAFAALAI